MHEKIKTRMISWFILFIVFALIELGVFFILDKEITMRKTAYYISGVFYGFIFGALMVYDMNKLKDKFKEKLEDEKNKKNIS